MPARKVLLRLHTVLVQWCCTLNELLCPALVCDDQVCYADLQPGAAVDAVLYLALKSITVNKRNINCVCCSGAP
jgi:hypothetical protein